MAPRRAAAIKSAAKTRASIAAIGRCDERDRRKQDARCDCPEVVMYDALLEGSQETLEEKAARLKLTQLIHRESGAADLDFLMQLHPSCLSKDARCAVQQLVAMRRHLIANEELPLMPEGVQLKLPSSPFAGVGRKKRAGGCVWSASVSTKSRSINLGNFHDEICAARAHDLVALLFCPASSYRKLNFEEWTYQDDMVYYRTKTQEEALEQIKAQSDQEFDRTQPWCRSCAPGTTIPAETIPLPLTLPQGLEHSHQPPPPQSKAPQEPPQKMQEALASIVKLLPSVLQKVGAGPVRVSEGRPEAQCRERQASGGSNSCPVALSLDDAVSKTDAGDTSEAVDTMDASFAATSFQLGKRGSADLTPIAGRPIAPDTPSKWDTRKSRTLDPGRISVVESALSKPVKRWRPGQLFVKDEDLVQFEQAAQAPGKPAGVSPGLHAHTWSLKALLDVPSGMPSPLLSPDMCGQRWVTTMKEMDLEVDGSAQEDLCALDRLMQVQTPVGVPVPALWDGHTGVKTPGQVTFPLTGGSVRGHDTVHTNDNLLAFDDLPFDSPLYGCRANEVESEVWECMDAEDLLQIQKSMDPDVHF